MRLDKYLKVSRLIKRRTVANEACDAGRVLVNGKTARASYEVKPGDVLSLSLGARELKAEIVSPKTTRHCCIGCWIPEYPIDRHPGRVRQRTLSHGRGVVFKKPSPAGCSLFIRRRCRRSLFLMRASVF